MLNNKLTNENEQPLVCIIILNWNSYEVIHDCIISLMKVKYSNYRIVVVDNGSHDNSLIRLKEIFPDIDFVESEKNIGFAGGNNLGIKYAQDKYKPGYYLLLNNDTIVDEKFLEELVKSGSDDLNIGCTVPKILYYDQPDRLYYAGGRVEPISGLGKHIGGKKKDSIKYNIPKNIDFANGCCMLIKSKVFDEIGVFDETFFAVIEDVDLSYRMINKGFKIFYNPNAKIWHKQSYSSNQNKGSWFVYYLGSRNIIRYQLKYKYGFRLYSALLYVCIRWTLYNSLKSLLFNDKIRFYKILQGCVDGFKNRLRFVD